MGHFTTGKGRTGWEGGMGWKEVEREDERKGGEMRRRLGRLQLSFAVNAIILILFYSSQSGCQWHVEMCLLNVRFGRNCERKC